MCSKLFNAKKQTFGKNRAAEKFPQYGSQSLSWDVFDFQVQLVNDILNGNTKWSICTRKWGTASGSDGRALDWG